MSFEKLNMLPWCRALPYAGQAMAPQAGVGRRLSPSFELKSNHAAASTTAKPTPMADKPPITDANHTISRSSSHKVFHMCALPHSIRQLKINGTSIT